MVTFSLIPFTYFKGKGLDIKSLYATRFLEPKSLGVKPAHDGLVEIVYQCSKQKKDSILRHE